MPDIDLFWSSFSIHNSQNVGKMPSDRGSGCCIFSVVLDSTSRHQFSDIRLVVVCKDDEDMDDFNLVHVPYTRTPVNSSSEILARSRSLLSHHRSNIAKRDGHAVPYDGAIVNDQRRVCTVVLQARFEPDSTTGEWMVIKLTPLSQLLQSDSPLRIVYDFSQPCTPSQPSFVAYLRSTLELNVPREWSSSEGILSYSVRVIPTTRPAGISAVVTLPRSVIRHIVLFVVGNRTIGWRADLLSCGLLCKAWVHVLDMFYQCLDGTNDGWGNCLDMPNIISVVHSLRMRPERARFLRVYDTVDYDNSSLSDDESWQYMLELLDKVPHITTLVLHELPVTPVPPRLGQVLRNLRNVQSLYVDHDVFHMDTIQTWIAGWPLLKEVRLSDWSPDKPGTYLEPAPDYISSRIESLRLFSGYLTGVQLMRFVVGPSPPQLTKLSLASVRGLRNQDIFMILSAVSATLVEYEKVGPRAIERDPLSPGEDFALDAVMPHLRSLRKCRVLLEDISGLTISRKISSGSQPSRITIVGAERRRRSVSLLQLEEAIKVSGWDEIHIRCFHSDDMDSFERIKAIAHERGIHFHWD